MAFKRRSTRKPTFKPKRTAKVSLPVKRYVKKQLRTNSELKKIAISDYERSENNADYNTFFYPIKGLSQDVSVSGRVGEEIRLQGFQMKGVFTNTSSTTIYVRTIVCMLSSELVLGQFSNMFEMNANTPSEGNPNMFIETGDTLVDNANSRSKKIRVIYAPLNRTLITSVLHDHVTKLGPSTSIDGSNTRLYNKFIKLRNRKVKYQQPVSYDAGGVIVYGDTTCTSNLVVVNFYCDADNDTDDTPAVVEHSYMYQTWFRDT